MSLNTFNINGKSKAANSYDAIVIGSGISGGWAAKELCEQGLATLVLERGRDVVHLRDYPTATKAPWDFGHGGQLPLQVSMKTQSLSVAMLLTIAPLTFL